jgi:hypothetical protein
MACPELCNKSPFSAFTMLFYLMFKGKVAGPGMWNLRSLCIGSKPLVSRVYWVTSWWGICWLLSLSVPYTPKFHLIWANLSVKISFLGSQSGEQYEFWLSAHRWHRLGIPIYYSITFSTPRKPVPLLCRGFLFLFSTKVYVCLSRKSLWFLLHLLEVHTCCSNTCYWETPGLFGFSFQWLHWFPLPVMFLVSYFMNINQ